MSMELQLERCKSEIQCLKEELAFQKNKTEMRVRIYQTQIQRLIQRNQEITLELEKAKLAKEEQLTSPEDYHPETPQPLLFYKPEQIDEEEDIYIYDPDGKRQGKVLKQK